MTSIARPGAGPVRLHSSIVARTTLKIIGLSVIVGLVAILVSERLLEVREHERLNDNLGQLIAAVERTASIAAFASDPQLGAEVAAGLRHNEAVLAVRIYSGNQLLAGSGATPDRKSAASLDTIARPLYSPFAAEESIGRIEIDPAREKIHSEATRNAYFVAMLLAAQVAMIGCAVAWVVYRSITRPIKRIADGLHNLDVKHGAQLTPPSGSEEDEIGRLVKDVNSLVSRMHELLSTERGLREEHARSERRFRMIFENAETGIFVVDADGYLRSWNPAMARLVGSERFQQAGMPPRLDLLLGMSAEIVTKMADQARTQKTCRSEDLRLSDDSAHSGRWISLVLNVVGDGPLYGVANDITERKRAMEQVLSMAERDPLTGLFNRRGLQRIAGRILATVDQRHQVAVLMIDLDGFKAVNDNHGHETGDNLLIRVSQILASLLRKSDIVGRLGGDEFAVLLTELSEPGSATMVADKIVEACSEVMSVGGVNARIGASVGIAVAASPNEPFARLLDKADRAMYDAKRAGKSAYRVHATD